MMPLIADSVAFLLLMMPLIANSAAFMVLLPQHIADAAAFLLLLAVHLLRASSTPGGRAGRIQSLRAFRRARQWAMGSGSWAKHQLYEILP